MPLHSSIMLPLTTEPLPYVGYDDDDGYDDEAMPPRERSGQRGGDDIEIEVKRIDLDETEPRIARERLGDLHFGGEAETDDGLLDRCVLELCGSPDRFDLIGCQHLAEDQHLKDVGAV